MAFWNEFKSFKDIKRVINIKAYKTGDDFFNDVSSDPEVYEAFEHSGIVLTVVFCAYTCKDKITVHNQHHQKHKLEKNKDINRVVN